MQQVHNRNFKTPQGTLGWRSNCSLKQTPKPKPIQIESWEEFLTPSLFSASKEPLESRAEVTHTTSQNSKKRNVQRTCSPVDLNFMEENFEFLQEPINDTNTLNNSNQSVMLPRSPSLEFFSEESQTTPFTDSFDFNQIEISPSIELLIQTLQKETRMNASEGKGIQKPNRMGSKKRSILPKRCKNENCSQHNPDPSKPLEQIFSTKCVCGSAFQFFENGKWKCSSNLTSVKEYPK
jgi:hypothetical protein